MCKEKARQIISLSRLMKPKQVVRWHNTRINLHRIHLLANLGRFKLEQHFSAHLDWILGPEGTSGFFGGFPRDAGMVQTKRVELFTHTQLTIKRNKVLPNEQGVILNCSISNQKIVHTCQKLH